MNFVLRCFCCNFLLPESNFLDLKILLVTRLVSKNENMLYLIAVLSEIFGLTFILSSSFRALFGVYYRTGRLLSV